VLGVSSGAALGASAAIIAGLAGIYLLPLCAFAGAVIVLAVVLLLAYQGGTTNVYSLLLSGIIVGSICSSVLMLVISIAPLEGLHSITWWMLGNLQVISFPLLAFASALIALGFAGIWFLARQLNALALGREMAHYLGVRSGAVIIGAVILATLATAAAVAMSGLIGFVGLIIPHLVRLIIGPDHRRLVPASALAGGLFLVICDTVARTIFAPVEIPVGVITALIGGPFFLFLLRRSSRGWF
jgi:iron complex transport system permease protein